ncbi:MAG: hypothetical protein JSU87_04240 [Gemmatimonadota bacterium]|nr:MAG: hypothetical protein JSU87_04240 [Gemmatimonadota bacterium]
MLTIVFVATIVTLIVAHHFLIARPGERRAAIEMATSGLGPLSALMRPLPDDVSLQPTFTWARVDPRGQFQIGVHPMLLGLIGEHYHLDVLRKGRVTEGEPLIRVGMKDRHFTLRSPVTGTVQRIRQRFRRVGTPEPPGAAGRQWLCRVEPDESSGKAAEWLTGERALEWTRRQYAAIREHLLRLADERQVGLALADGGEVPRGILGQLDSDEWRTIQAAFFDD